MMRLPKETLERATKSIHEKPKEENLEKRIRKISRTIAHQGAPIAPKGFDHHMVGGEPLGWLFFGCHWFDNAGGCGPCDGYGKKDGVDKEAAVDEALAFFRSYTESKLKEKSRVTLNLGSATTFNDKYFPPELRAIMFKGINDMLMPFVAADLNRLFVFETRLTDVRKKQMEELRTYIDPRIPVEIGIGFEATQSHIQNGLANKGYGEKALEHFRKLIEDGKHYAIGFEGHALLGIPGLNEAEAIVSAVETTRDLLDIGVGRVILMTTNIKQGASLGSYLHNKGRFRPPSIHATVEAARMLNESGHSNFLAFGFAAADPTVAYAEGCGYCTERIKDALNQYAVQCIVNGADAASRYLSTVDLDCASCKPTWIAERERETKGNTLMQRTPGFLQQIEFELGLGSQQRFTLER